MAEAGPLERQAEDTRPVNSLSYLPMSKLTKERWSGDDTERFYQAVATVGLDFTMIAKFFQGRTRKQVRRRLRYIVSLTVVALARCLQTQKDVFMTFRSLALTTAEVCCCLERCRGLRRRTCAIRHVKLDVSLRHSQVKNKYLKESKVNSKRMTLAMSGKLKDVDSLRESAAFLKKDADAGDGDAAGTESGAAGAASGSQAGGPVSSGAAPSGAGAAAAGAGTSCSGKAAKARHAADDADDDDDDGIVCGDAVDRSMANFFY